MGNSIHGTNFVADGPAPEGSGNIGFETIRWGGFQTGVLGRRTGAADGTSEGVGVLGMSVNAEGDPAPGVGVEGYSASGPGVAGRADRDGIGVQGQSDTGTGVSGTSNSIGVQGGGGSIGVQGEGASVGVLGGGAPAALTTQPSYAAVAGNGPNDPSGWTFSYGGWFSRGDGIQGVTAQLHLEPAGPDDPGRPPAAQARDLFVEHPDASGTVKLWFCTRTGDSSTPTPPGWSQLA